MESPAIHESKVFAWVFWRKMKEIRVSCETFVKKSAGAPATTARAEPPVQGKTLAGKGGEPRRGRGVRGGGRGKGGGGRSAEGGRRRTGDT